MASRESMNMGSRSSTVISELKSVISLLGQTADSAYQKVASSASKMYASGGAAPSNNLVAPGPVFSSAPAITYLTETGSGIVAAGPSASAIARGSGTNLSEYAAQTGGGTTYKSETSGGGGGGVGGTGGGLFGGGRGGNSSATGAAQQGWSNIPGVGTLVGTAFGIYNAGANLTPNTSDILEAQLLQQRASFYTGVNSKLVSAGDKQSITDVQDYQKSMAKLAMLSGDNPQMDVMRAQIAAQSYGLGYGVNNLLKSAANVSNLLPGLGVEGSIRATGAMQQGYNVNMLRGIGIQLRGPDGSLKGPDAVIDDVWAKICRDYGQAYGSGKSPSLKEVQISLQPGNALDSMLNQYFGNDPMLKQLVANGLIYKAQGGMSFDATGNAAIKAGITGLAGTTTAMTSYTDTAAAGQGFLTAGQGSASQGFTEANNLISSYYTKATAMAKLVIQKALGDTLLTAFGGNPLSTFIGVGAGQNIITPEKLASLMNLTDPLNAVKSIPGVFGDIFGTKGLLGILQDAIPFLATGGPVTSGSPYIVGEKGPELFVPSTNGNVVSNDQLKTGGSFTYNFTINAASGNTQDLVAEIKSALIQIETNRKVSES